MAGFVRLTTPIAALWACHPTPAGWLIMVVDWRDHIVSTPDVIRGKPRIKGTRIPVSLILGYLAAGKSVQEIVTDLPDLEEVHIAACLQYARDVT